MFVGIFFIYFLLIEMKKLLWTMLAWMFGIALSVWSASAASSDCLNISFSNWDSICLGITKNGNKNFEISVDKNNLSKNSEIKCYVILDDSSVRTLNNCKWTFNYTSSNTEDVVINTTYVLKNKDFYSKRVSTEVNFNKGTWKTNKNLISSSKSSSSSKKSRDDLDVSVSPSSPDTYDWVKLTIETDDDYSGKINFSKFQYRSSNSSSWSDISRTSSTYVSDYSNDWENGYYRMTSSDDGEVTLKNLVKFKKSGYYRIYVEDTDGNESYVQINVDTSSSSSSNNGDLDVSVSPSSPDTYDWVKLTIETDDDYSGKINFSKFQYRSSNSSSWSDISRTSSTYVSDYSNDWENGYYRMTSSDDGEVTLKNLVKFKKSGYYRISVSDTDGNENYVQFSVGDVKEDSSSKSSVSWFSSKELAKIRSVYNQWDTMISQMKKEYPSLKKDTYWVKLSDNFYSNIKDVINGKKSRNFEDYDDYVKAFNSRYKYTTQNK